MEQRIGLIEEWNLDRTVDGGTTYGIFDGDRLVGGTGLHRRSDAGVFEIGYWVHVGCVRRGIAT